LAAGHFDESLKSYRVAQEDDDRETLINLLSRFIAYKERTRDPRTLEKYRALRTYLEAYDEDLRAISDVSERVVASFARRLREGLSDRTAKDHLISMAAAWDWGANQPENPWRAAIEEIRVAPLQPLKPFSEAEVRRILGTMRSHPYWNHYHDFVAFLMVTGCRTGEAIALRWEHLSDDFSYAWIGESWNGKRRKPTKTRQSRDVAIVPGMRHLLRSRAANPYRGDLVFTSPAGCHINAGNFRKRVWIPTLKAAKVPYRKPYNSRRTAISHSIAAGNSPVDVAAQVGNHPRILYEHYAGAIAKPKMVDFVEDEDLQ
jgi:integrase